MLMTICIAVVWFAVGFLVCYSFCRVAGPTTDEPVQEMATPNRVPATYAEYCEMVKAYGGTPKSEAEFNEALVRYEQ